MTGSEKQEKPALDIWAEWLLKRRFGDDAQGRAEGMKVLYNVRDRVLARSGLKENGVLLDVGTGDGLIASGALEIVGPGGSVLFSDISEGLIALCREQAEQTGILPRCRFLIAAADSIPLASGSVDAVTTRSVLIYVKNKKQAFKEFHRVLKPGGRMSLFEPVNVFAKNREENTFSGIDVTPVAEIAAKVQAIYSAIQGPNDPMLDFDERDLLRLAEEAGFREVHLEYEANIRPAPAQDWRTALGRAGNPLIPTLAEAMAQALSAQEAAAFEEHVRPIFERGGYPVRAAVAYLWAAKGE